MLKISQDNKNITELTNRVLKFKFFKTGTLRGRFNIHIEDIEGNVCNLQNCYMCINYFLDHSKKLEEYPSHKFNYTSTIEVIDDELGKGFELQFNRINPDKGKFNFTLLVKLYDHRDFILLRLINIKDLTSNYLNIHSISPLTLKEEKLYLSKNKKPTDLRKVTWFKNGWQSWSPCRLFYGNESDRKGPPLKVFKRTLDNQDYEIEGRFYSEYNTVITDFNSKNSLLLGFSTLKEQFSRIILDYDKSDTIRLLTAFGCMDGVQLPKSSIDTSEELFVGFKSENRGYYGLIDYAKVVYEHLDQKPVSDIPVVGWASWYYYFTEITEEDMINNLQFFKSNEETFPIDFIQLDDGYFTKIGDYDDINKDFSHGLDWLFEKVTEADFKGGLWTAPFFAEKDSKLFQAHPDWFLTKKGKDKMLKTHYNWGTFLYSLDFAKEVVLNYIEEFFRNALYAFQDRTERSETLIEFFKIDFLHAATPYDADYARTNLTRAQLYRNAVKAVRDGITDDSFLLGCGAPLGPCVGLVNAMRISMDTAPEWEKWDWIGDRFGFTLPGLKRALINILYRSYTHKYFWINDPDCLMIRRTDTDLTLNEIKLQLTLFGLSGGQILISDDMTKLSNEELNDAKLVIPPYNPELYDPILTDAFTSPVPTIYFLETLETIGKRYLAAITNWDDNTVNRTITISEIIPNLPKDENEFYIYDFWSRRFLGTFTPETPINLTIPQHFCSYLSIIYVNGKIKQEPLLLSSDLHVTQGCCEMTKFDYDDEENKISIIIDLLGVRKGSLFIKLPTEKEITECEYQYDLKNKKENIWIINLEFIDSCSFKIGLS